MRIVLFLCLLIASPVLSQTYPEYQVGPVVDNADLLPADAETALSEQLKALRRDTRAEVFVLTIPTQGDFNAGETVEDFAAGTFDAWRLGDPLKQDGVLVVLIRDDATAHIALGEGFAGDLASAAERITTDTFLPALQTDTPVEGIVRGVTATIDQVVMPFLEAPQIEEPSGGLRISFNPALLIVGVLALYGVFAARRHLSSLFARARSCPECGARTIRETSKRDVDPTIYVPGRGTRRRWCESCDYVDESTYIIPKLTNTDQSRFGGSG